MTLETGSKLYHNGANTPVQLLEFVEEWHGDRIWIAKDLPDGMTHIMRIKPRDIITPYREAA